jgi:hypothetical protein
MLVVEVACGMVRCDEAARDMDFLTTRKGSGFDRFDATVMALYAGVLAWGIHFYQPFVDEAQAWLIARDSSLRELLLRRLHYEGAPALWPLLLWLANRLHLPYAGINWMGGCFAMVGIYILLRFAPFPRIFRWLLPFTYFLQYQYAVVARPYVMYPALLFTLCIVFTMRKPRPVLFGLIAGLLANISLHAAIVAGIFALLYLYELYQSTQHSTKRVSFRQVAAGFGLFVVLSLCSASVAFPTSDAATAFSSGKSLVKPNAILLKLVPEDRLPLGAPPLDAPFTSGGGTNAISKPYAGYSPIVFLALKTIILGGDAAFYPIAQSNMLAICFMASICLWLGLRGCLRLLLSVNVFVFDHHTGIFLLALVAAAWIALNRTSDEAAWRRPRWIEPAFCAVSLIVISLQIGWSVHCIRAIALSPSDPGRETEAFLVKTFAGKRIAGFGFESTSTQAYSPQKLFFNQPHAFWLWSVGLMADRRRTEALEQHPDVVVVADVTSGGDVIFNQWMPVFPVGKRSNVQMIEFWEENGYRTTHQFCGNQFRRAGLSYTFCELIMEPDSAAKDGPVRARGTH